MNDASGGLLMAETLAMHGVRDVFALHGGHLDAFLVAAPETGIRIVDTRHEASAGHAADAYARVSGDRVGVAVITAGPGFTNGLTPMVSAYLDAIPTLFFAGAPPLREAETNPLQGGFDQVAMAAPASKWAHRVTRVERLPDLIDKALRIAREGRPGPVFLEIPIDVMFAPVDRDRTAASGPAAVYRPAPPAEAVTAILSLLGRAERPVILAGGGAMLSRAGGALERFAEAARIPVVTNSRAHGLLPPDHPLYCGGAGTLAAANLIGQPADLVLLAGARQGLFTGGSSGAIIPTDAHLIQVDVDAAEIGRLRPADVGVVADCRATFTVLAERSDSDWPDRSPWLATLKNLRAAGRSAFDSQPVRGKTNLLHPAHAARAVLEALDPDTTLITDGGESSAWCEPHVRAPGPGRFMSNGYLGCLGCGPGMAIGAATALPGRPVAVISGDGAAGFNIQEFDTMVRHELPVLTVVLNNRCWGMSQHGQDIVFGSNHRSAVALADARYDEVAAGFGARGFRIDTLEDIAPAVREAQTSGQPACINILIDPDVVHPVTPAMIGATDSDDQIAVPYYENIPDD